jgi:hypothetical protein
VSARITVRIHRCALKAGRRRQSDKGVKSNCPCRLHTFTSQLRTSSKIQGGNTVSDSSWANPTNWPKQQPNGLNVAHKAACTAGKYALGNGHVKGIELIVPPLVKLEV